MRAEVLNDLRAELEKCTAGPEAIAEFRQMIEVVGARHGLTVPLQDQRVEFARQLLSQRCSRPDIRDRLMHRFLIGESQAYRDIHAALQIVPKPG